MSNTIHKVATLLAFAVLASACADQIDSPAGPETAQASAGATAATTLVFSQVSAGGLDYVGQHACGVTAEGLAYCWGYNDDGQLGNGTKTGPETCTPSPTEQTVACSTRPVAVVGGHVFRQISAGGTHTCGIDTERRAYCWGTNVSGALGDGTTKSRPTPVAVQGGLRFRQIEAGFLHTCGLTYPDNLVYCWGLNGYGQLGDGTTTSRPLPVAVAGGRTFRQITAGDWFTCAVTPANAAYCWGWNKDGQVGDSSMAGRRQQPVRVAGGHLFRQVDAGGRHACAVTLTNQAYCWGNGEGGQLGNGKRNTSFWPRLVSGGLSLERVTAGEDHSCGETSSNEAYCWGFNSNGELGNAVYGAQAVPVAVAGGLHLSQVSAGGDLTCGRTTAGLAYCWGRNHMGQVGDGTKTDRSQPAPVAGP